MSCSNKIIELKNVSMVREHRTILHDINLCVDKGDFMAITGPNGGGKTTLLRLILKLMKPTSGSVEYFNEMMNKVAKLPIGYLPQKNLIDNHFPITLREVVASGLLNSKLPPSEKKRRVDTEIERVSLTEHADSPIGVLSGGQFQRGLLARAIISSPSVLVLDEPLSYLDKKFEAKVYDILNELSETTTIILVSHEMSTIAEMANRHIIVERTLHECCAKHHFIVSECD